jgi:hypothetical protein
LRLRRADELLVALAHEGALRDNVGDVALSVALVPGALVDRLARTAVGLAAMTVTPSQRELLEGLNLPAARTPARGLGHRADDRMALRQLVAAVHKRLD